MMTTRMGRMMGVYSNNVMKLTIAIIFFFMRFVAFNLYSLPGVLNQYRPSPDKGRGAIYDTI